MDQKRTIVANLISHFWNKQIQEQINSFSSDQVEFLFKYFFTESRETRERMCFDMQTQFEATLKEIEYIAEKIQRLNIEYSEMLAAEEDKENFLKN